MRKSVLILLGVCLLIACSTKASSNRGEEVSGNKIYQDNIQKENVELTTEEVRLFKEINKFHPEIKLSRIARLYEINTVRYLKLDFQNNLDSNNLFFSEYIEYDVTIVNEEFEYKVDYVYSVGQAFSVVGNIILNKITGKIFKVEYSYGTGAGTTEVCIDGQIIYEKDNNL